ncbi:hypothetical protein A9974_19750 [Achromobacter sp. UMC71]|nr:hypothetical protein [Achromobacter sp. UMC71]
MTASRGQAPLSFLRLARALVLGAVLAAIAFYRPLDARVLPAWYVGAGDVLFVIVCMLAAALGRGPGFRDIWSRGFVSAFLLYSPALLQGGRTAVAWMPTMLAVLLLAWPLLWLFEALWWRRAPKGT